MAIESILVGGGILVIGVIGKLTADAKEEYLIQKKKYFNDRAEEPYFIDILIGEVKALICPHKYKNSA